MKIIKKQKIREVLISLDVEIQNRYCDEWYDDMDKLKTLLDAQLVVSIDFKSVDIINYKEAYNYVVKYIENKLEV